MVDNARPVPDWLSVSRETLSKLEGLLDLVIKWNPRINLVSAASLNLGWQRHVLDSAQLWGLMPIPSGIWLDVGSGAGFPGLVIAVLAQAQCPDLRVVLVESDRRKAVFLNEALRQLHLSAKVHCARIEDLPPFEAQIVSARALAVVENLLPMLARHMAEEGTALLPKGLRHAQELENCSKSWVMHNEIIPSRTDPDGVVLKISGLRHV